MKNCGEISRRSLAENTATENPYLPQVLNRFELGTELQFPRTVRNEFEALLNASL